MNDYVFLFVNGLFWNFYLYGGLIKEYDFEKVVIVFGKIGYLFDLEYVVKLIELIKKVNLNKYDIVYSECVLDKVIKVVGEVVVKDNCYVWFVLGGIKGVKFIVSIIKYFGC